MSAAPVDWRTRLRWLLTRYGIDTAHGWRMGIASLLLRQPNGTPPWRHWLARHFPHIRFDQPHPGDLLRIPLQLLWLALVRPARPAPVLRRGYRWYDPARWPAWLRPRLALPALAHGPAQAAMAQYGNRASTWITRFADLSLWQRAPVRYLVWGIAGVLALLCVTTPLDTVSQLVFATLIFALVFVIQSIQGPLATLLLISLSIVVSSRYLWWRFSTTLNWDQPLDWLWGLLLLGAELHTWLILVFGYVQTAWPLQRPAVSLPQDTSLWPAVDIFIPTYNEPLDLVRKTILAAREIDYPADRLNIYVLDDGRREEYRLFAGSVGVHYLTRPDNRHAKAGNLNHALAHSHGEFVAIFDCDHIPTRSFLQTSMGWFLRDRKLALVQTPHHFYSADPFERNLGTFRVVPNEGELFYGLIQDGNDFWNAAFFCGSCAVLRREPLLEVGGVAVETVTEDAHTALRLHRAGYRSAYIKIPQAAGLATETLSAHIGQRIRWSRGMAQIFRFDNPFFGKGLSWGQRICYGNAMMHFFGGIPRLVFLTSPLAFLLFHSYIIYAPPVMVLAYALLHMGVGSMTNSHIQGRYRYSFWGELYETVLSWYIVRPTAAALLNPRGSAFNVTAKGGLVEHEFFDLTISTPFLSLIALNGIGLAAGIARSVFGPPEEIATVWLNMGWTFYNLLILGGAIFVASEARQLRISHRVRMELPAILHLPDGRLVRCTTEDVSMGGAALLPATGTAIRTGDTVAVSLWRGTEEYVFPARVIATSATRLRLHWQLTGTQQESALVQCTFSRADAWIDWTRGRPADRPLFNLFGFVSSGVSGYRRLGIHLLSRFDSLGIRHAGSLQRISWWLPRQPLPPLNTDHETSIA